jgi:hypothetical protein
MIPADVIAIVRPRRGQWALYFLLGIAEQESGRHDRRGALIDFDERAFLMDHNGGSYGLFQLDLPTARDRGYTGDGNGLFDPATNTEFAVRQFDWIADRLKHASAYGPQNLIAAYNEGVGNVLRGNPDPRYVGLVMGYRERWRFALGEGVE